MIFFRKITFWLALLGLAAAASLTLRMRANLSEPAKAPPIAPPAKPFPHAIGASGLVEASHENIHIGVPQPGLATQVYVSVWDRVAAGSPLIQLDDRDLRATLISQQAQIKVSEATLQRLRDQLSRLEAVSDLRAISLEDLKNRQSDVAVAQAQLAASQAAITQTQTLLDRLLIRAPSAGTILQVNLRAGEYVSPSAATAPIILGDIEELQIRADVDEQIAPRVKAGKNAIGYLKGDTQHALSLQFVRIEPFVIPKRSLTGSSIERVDTRVLQVIFKLPANPAHPIYVGQQLDLYIEE